MGRLEEVTATQRGLVPGPRAHSQGGPQGLWGRRWGQGERRGKEGARLSESKQERKGML